MNLLDSIIIVLFIVGILGGLKSGVIKSTVTLVGTIIVFILAFYLKNPLATILYTYLPFFDILNGAVVINILLYEFIAFLIAIAILSLALGILIKVSGFIEKVFNATIILGMISKLLSNAKYTLASVWASTPWLLSTTNIAPSQAAKLLDTS